MTVTAAIILLYLAALFLTVATLLLVSYRTPTNFPKKTSPQFVWILIFVVLPFVMLIYFGVAFLIGDKISEGADWLNAMRSELGADWLKTKEEELSFTESLVAAVSYVGLSGWLWLRWRNPIAPSTKILGPVIIATVIILIIVGVIWVPDYHQIF